MLVLTSGSGLGNHSFLVKLCISALLTTKTQHRW